MIRNSLFKKFDQLRAWAQEIQYGHFQINRGSELSQLYDEHQSNSNWNKKIKFYQQQLVDYQKDPYEKQKLSLYLQYWNSQIDKITYEKEVLKVNQNRKLRMIIESQNDYDPDAIEFEKLKMKVIMNEENAVENYKNFLIKKPYMRKIHENKENQNMKHFVQF